MSNNPGTNIPYPLQIPGCVAWLNADYPLSITAAQPADGTAMTSWVNLAGQRLTYTQGTSTNQPVFKTNVNVGKSGILFDGSNDGISCAGSPINSYVSYASNAVFTMVFTFKALAITNVNGQNLQSMRGSVATDKTTVGIDTGLTNLYFEVNNAGVITNVATSFTDTTNNHVVIVTNDGANGIALYLDGVTAAGTTVLSGTSGNANTVYIGNVPAFTRGWNGYIYDHVFYSRVITSTERTNINRFFANLRGITI